MGPGRTRREMNQSRNFYMRERVVRRDVFSSDVIESCYERKAMAIRSWDTPLLNCASPNGTLKPQVEGAQPVEEEVVQGPVHDVFADTTVNHPIVRGLDRSMR